MEPSSFEQLVLAQLTAIKDDVNRASDRHDAALKKLFEIQEGHAKDDILRFEGIDRQFTQAAVTAAEAKGAAKTTAKFWGLCAGLPAPVIAGLWAIFKYLHAIHMISFHLK